jgi:tripartite-type tricarboxylate transporter receptor subunit TctC
MKRPAALVTLATLTISTCLSSLSFGEGFPARPVSIITPSGPGVGGDPIIRIVAERLTRTWGRQVVILNRPGGGGLIAAQAAASTAERDGHTLYMPLASTFLVLPEIQPKLPFDLQHDLVPIGVVGEQPMIFAASPSLGVKTLGELVALARKEPRRVMFGGGRGTMPHLAGLLLAQRAKAEISYVPYPDAGRALGDVLGGTLTLMIESAAGISGTIKSGELIPLAVAAAQRLPDYPDLPTVTEAMPELGGFEARGWFVLSALAGVSDEVVQKVSRDLRAALQEPEIASKLAALGTYPRTLTSDEIRAFIQAERDLWRPIVRQSGLAQQ